MGNKAPSPSTENKITTVTTTSNNMDPHSNSSRNNKTKPTEPVAPAAAPAAAAADPAADPAKKSYFSSFSWRPSWPKFWGGSHEKVVIVNLWAKWCGHCQALKPIWKQLVHHYSKNPNIIFEQLEDENIKKGGLIGLKKKYGDKIEDPQGFPTLYIFLSSDMKKQAPYHGERTFEGIKKEIDNLLMQVRKGHHNSTVKKGGAKKKKANKTMHKRR